MATNEEVVRTLELIADLLEIRGENAFKVRAYRSAAEQIDNLGTPIAEIAADQERLMALQGFGPAIAAKVTELVETGNLEFLEKLRTEVPESLIEVRHIAGVGPKTAGMLYRERGVQTVSDLVVVAKAGGLEGLPRLGDKSVAKILAALDDYVTKGVNPRRLRSEVEGIAHKLRDALRDLPATVQADIAGSFRRQSETVGDLDIVVATLAPAPTLEHFAHLESVEDVMLRGDTKCSVHVDGGFQVDCRAVAPQSFGAAMQYFTGSQRHNVQLRARAIKLGYTLNEYGVYPIGSTTAIAGETEEDVYAALGLRWVEPVERLGKNEVEMAELTPVGGA